MNELNKIKLFVDARFKPRLDFFSKVHEFAQKFTEDYPDWETDGLKVSLKCKEDKKLILFSHDRVVFSWEQTFNEEEVVSHIKEVLTEYSKLYGELDYSWFGVRSRGYVKQDVTFEELVKLFHFRFHSTDLQKLDYFGGNTTDDSFVANSTIDGWDYRFELGPCNNKELLQRLNSKMSQFKASDLPDVGVYFDIDTHVTSSVGSIDDALGTGLEKLNRAIETMSTFVAPKG